MKTFTTRAYSQLPDADEIRSSGPPEYAVVLTNESETFKVEALITEVEAFEEESGSKIDSDVIEDKVMEDLIEFLNLNHLLDAEP